MSHDLLEAVVGADLVFEVQFFLRQLVFVSVQLLANFRVVQADHLCRQNPGIGCARLADGDGCDGNAGRHLHHGQQRIETQQRRRWDRHGDHRQRRLSRDHAGQVRGATGSGNHDLHPPFL